FTRHDYSSRTQASGAKFLLARHSSLVTRHFFFEPAPGERTPAPPACARTNSRGRIRPSALCFSATTRRAYSAPPARRAKALSAGRPLHRARRRVLPARSPGSAPDTWEERTWGLNRVIEQIGRAHV